MCLDVTEEQEVNEDPLASTYEEVPTQNGSKFDEIIIVIKKNNLIHQPRRKEKERAS
jgi:hypothetical protein